MFSSSKALDAGSNDQCVCSSPICQSSKLRECLSHIILPRNRVECALSGDDVKKTWVQLFIKIDGKVWADTTHPASLMDAISIDKTRENFHLIYDIKCYFVVHHITPEEAKYKMCQVRKIFEGTQGITQLVIDSLFRLILRLAKLPISSRWTLVISVYGDWRY